MIVNYEIIYTTNDFGIVIIGFEKVDVKQITTNAIKAIICVLIIETYVILINFVNSSFDFDLNPITL